MKLLEHWAHQYRPGTRNKGKREIPRKCTALTIRTSLIETHKILLSFYLYSRELCLEKVQTQ